MSANKITNSSSPAISTEIQKTPASKFQSNSQSNSQIKNPTPNQTPEKREWTVTVPGNVKWKNTGIRVQQGTRLYISASGTITWAADRIPDWTIVGPNGSSPPDNEDFPIPQAGIGSLVMRIGNVKYTVGANKSIEAKESGTIELMVNDDILTDNSGSFTVNIKY